MDNTPWHKLTWSKAPGELTMLHMKFEEIWPRVSEKSFKGVNGQKD